MDWLTTISRRNSRHALEKPTEPATGFVSNIVSRLKFTFIFHAQALGLLTLLLAVSPPSFAGDMEEIVVYGRAVPTGFYHYTSSSMTSGEMRSMYLDQTAYRGGMTLYDQINMQWNQRCGSMMGTLKNQLDTCVDYTHEQLDEMLSICDIRASGRSIDATLSITLPVAEADVGISFTWTAPSHNYEHCADDANNQQIRLEKKCESRLDRAKREERTCQGHHDWQ